MSTAELKNTKEEVVAWIESLKDDSLLGLLSFIKLSNEGQNSDWWEELNQTDKDNISLGIKDLEEGNTMSSNEFWKGLTNG